MPRLPIFCMLFPLLVANAQQTVSVHVVMTQGTSAKTTTPSKDPRTGSLANPAVVWLEPLQREHQDHVDTPHTYTMVQHDKMFSPSMLVVPVGSVVSFPNKDPFFHNVFSFFNGQRFDLGLYQAGQTRNVTFSRAGVSYIFCNIHPEMAAAIIALDTPHYALVDEQGDATLLHVPSGSYALHVWSEFASPEDLAAVTREVSIGEEHTDLGVITIHNAGAPWTHHLNKFGQNYETHPPEPYQ